MRLLRRIINDALASRARSRRAATAEPASSESASDTIASAIAAAGRLSSTGNHAEALAQLNALESDQHHGADLEYAKGLVLLDWGRYREARARLLAAEALGQHGFALHLNLSHAAHFLGCREEAEQHARRAIDLDPHSALAQLALASVLFGAKRYDDAVEAYAAARALDRTRVDVLGYLGACKLEGGDGPAAEQYARQLLDARPADPKAWSLLAMSLNLQGRWDECLASFERAGALALEQGQAHESWGNHGAALLAIGRPADAIPLFERHLTQYPSPVVHGQYAFALLSCGRFREGWQQYEFRWVQEPFIHVRHASSTPRWQGQDLRGKTLLVWSEQGAGDLIQFARFASELRDRGATVLLQVPDALKAFAEGFVDVDRVVTASEPPHGFDYQIPLMSVPLALDACVPTAPRKLPYYRVDPAQAGRVETMLAASGLRVGIVWAGNAKHKNDHNRSVPLAMLAPVLRSPGVSFHSLQKEKRLGDDALLENVIDLSDALGDFRDTAAIIAELDLVITVDTAVAHLAGAVGKPVWLMVPAAPDFRWLISGDRSAWYPTMRIFRQRSRGDWASVVADVQAALDESVGNREPVRVAAPPPVSLAETSDIERASSGVKLTRVVEARHGVMQYEADDSPLARSLAFYGEWIEPVVEVLQKLLGSGSVVVDAGSRCAEHALSLARSIGVAGHLLVYADGERARRLVAQNLQYNRLSGAATVMHRSLAGPKHADVSAMPPHATSPSDTIDALQLERLDVLKISDAADAGAVLAGASDSLWRLRPAVVATLGSAAARAELGRYLSGFSYRSWAFDVPLFHARNHARRDRDIFAGANAYALLALPEERELPPGISAIVTLSAPSE